MFRAFPKLSLPFCFNILMPSTLSSEIGITNYAALSSGSLSIIGDLFIQQTYPQLLPVWHILKSILIDGK